MGREIERKFLVDHDAWEAMPKPSGTLIAQGYIANEPGRSVRIRIAGDRSFLTLKGQLNGLSRPEFEYPIPLADAREMMSLFCKEMISKTRYRITFNGRTWEVDVFHDMNDGLIVAEVELDTPDEVVALPAWVTEEVSDDPRYLNTNLIRFPYTTW
jgi:adenylate cyclase